MEYNPKMTRLRHNQILDMLKANKTYLEITKKTGASSHTIFRIRKELHDSYSGNKAGRKRDFDEATERMYVRALIIEDIFSKKKTKKYINDNYGVDIHEKTLGCILKRHDCVYRIKKKKPLMSRVNRLKRLRWGLKYKDKPLSFWRGTTHADETKLDIWSPKIQVGHWRKKLQSIL